MKKFIFGFLLLTFLVVGKCNSFADDSLVINSAKPDIVKVGISNNSFSQYYYSKIEFTSDDDIVVSDNSTQEVCFKSNEVITVELKNDKFTVNNGTNTVLETENNIKIIPANGQMISVVGLNRKGRPAKYWGNFELIKNNPNKFALVNVLPLQTYLKGVVPNEMPTYFGLEALKAQAVLARNYVLKPREKYFKEFDICDSVSCQVYFGGNTQESLSDKAVDETNNIVVTHNNNLILAVYSSTAGGYSESYQNAFMQSTAKGVMAYHVPYLVATPDFEGIKDLSDEKNMREFYSEKQDALDSDSPYFRWQRTWLIEDLEKILPTTIKSVSKTGFLKAKKETNYSDKDYFGHLKSIYINKRGQSGKIVAMTIVTDKNEFTVYKELIIRKVFQHEGKMLPSANVFFDFEKDENDKPILKATGGGFGHGVGMSQWGAGKMSKNGYKFDEIIKHYYKDVKISTTPIVVTAQKPAYQEFYRVSSKGILKSDNKLHFSELEIIINNENISEEELKKLQKDKQLDVSKHLKRGKNTVIYDVKGNGNKEIKFMIEFEK